MVKRLIKDGDVEKEIEFLDSDPELTELREQVIAGQQAPPPVLPSTVTIPEPKNLKPATSSLSFRNEGESKDGKE